MALWGGRFAGETDGLMRRFGDSIGFDRRMYGADVRGSIAYAGALARAGLITNEERDQLIAGLEQVRAEFDAGTFQIEPGDHPGVVDRPHTSGPSADRLHATDHGIDIRTPVDQDANPDHLGPQLPPPRQDPKSRIERTGPPDSGCRLD